MPDTPVVTPEELGSLIERTTTAAMLAFRGMRDRDGNSINLSPPKLSISCIIVGDVASINAIPLPSTSTATGTQTQRTEQPEITEISTEAREDKGITTAARTGTDTGSTEGTQKRAEGNTTTGTDTGSTKSTENGNDQHTQSHGQLITTQTESLT